MLRSASSDTRLRGRKQRKLVSPVVLITATMLTAWISVTFEFFPGFCSSASAQSSSFRFLAWADTKTGTATLTNESKQAIALNPVFSIYPGDVCTSGPDASCFATWKTALNGGGTNTMFDKTFASRGNHDSSGGSFWQSAFEISATTSRIGAINYTALTQDMTYSFDYENSHFVGIDVLGDVTLMPAAAIAWLDNDLTDAENRGLTHAFLFWHGPIYSLAEHCCATAPSSLVNVLNKHSIISATFHGHEHVVAYTHMDSSRITGLTHAFEEFVSGDAGAGPDTARPDRYDWWIGNSHGFVMVDVSGQTFTVSAYALGNTNPVKVWNFTNSTGSDNQAPAAPSYLRILR